MFSGFQIRFEKGESTGLLCADTQGKSRWDCGSPYSVTQCEISEIFLKMMRFIRLANKPASRVFYAAKRARARLYYLCQESGIRNHKNAKISKKQSQPLCHNRNQNPSCFYSGLLKPPFSISLCPKENRQNCFCHRLWVGTPLIVSLYRPI